MVFAGHAMLLAPSRLRAQTDTDQVGPILKQQFQAAEVVEFHWVSI